MRTRRVLTFAVIALSAVAARLPFLLRADRFFDADEAVEGLMARHIGDHPLFLWGQRYKGTPEVFLTSAAFHIAGSSVVALKAVTLACFVVFLCVNFRLLDRVFSRRVAWTATAFFIVGPPSLVLWTLSGSAEMVMTFLAGAILLLAAASRRWTVAAAALGAGLWIHQYILYYVVSLVIAAAFVTPGWREIVRDAVRTRMPRWLRAIAAALLAAGVFYVVLGLIPFFMMQVHVTVGGVPIAVTNPQKMWWLAGAFFAWAALLAVVAIFRERLLAPTIGLLIGYSPAIIGRIGNHGLGAPIARLDFAGLRAAMPDIRSAMLPMLFGWRDPAGNSTVYPALGLVLLFVVVISYWNTWRLRMPPIFHIFPLVAAAMFLVSGSYIDAQSYRYLMPIYAGLPVIYAIGVEGAWRVSRAAGAALVACALLIFGAQQIEWYRLLQPDALTQQAIACLDAAGVTAARAPYWQSYTVTFLTRERIIVSPVDGIDRYAPYSDRTRSSPTLDRIGCRPAR
jgi:hypothetical protein